MAPSHTPTTTTTNVIVIGHNEKLRLMIILVGCALLFAAFVTPWWTRGFTLDWDDKEGRARTEDASGIEGVYHNYGPYDTPGGGSDGDSYDSGRATAVAILGIGLTATALFVAATLAIRYLMLVGRVEASHDLPVQLSIVAAMLGIFTVLWAAFFLPLAGPGGGLLYGEEPESGRPDLSAFSPSQRAQLEEQLDEAYSGMHVARYANVGFFLGIVGAVGFPAFLWFDAARTRALADGSYGTATGNGITT